MKYEYKIKNGQNWDESPVIETQYFEDIKSVWLYAMALADKEYKEVRMNESGSKQGHYARPWIKCNGICRPTVMSYDKNCPIHGWQ